MTFVLSVMSTNLVCEDFREKSTVFKILDCFKEAEEVSLEDPFILVEDQEGLG